MDTSDIHSSSLPVTCHSPLVTLLRARIAEVGPISLSEYMDTALSHPEHGYYKQQRVFGAGGDFITSPEISQVFGEMLGVWCVEAWQKLGGENVALVEMGPGRGTLMSDLLRATRSMGGFHDALSIHMIESSPLLANTQYHALRNMHPRIEWLDAINQLPTHKPIIVVANEFFDALPIKQHVKTEAGICERRVDWDDDAQEFRFVLGPPGLQLAKSATVIADGTVIESCPAAREMMRELARKIHIQGGAALIIDYGYLGDAHTDTLQAVKNHMYHHVLKDPGEADITAHVDFSTLMKIAHGEGVAVHGLSTQGRFLATMGVEIRLEALMKRAAPEQREELVTGVTRLISPQAMGDLFKVMAMTSQHYAPSGF